MKADEPVKDIKKQKRHSKKKSLEENVSNDKTIKKHKEKSYKKRNETKEGFLLSLDDDENHEEEKQVTKKKVKKEKKEKKKLKDKERKFMLYFICGMYDYW